MDRQTDGARGHICTCTGAAQMFSFLARAFWLELRFASVNENRFHEEKHRVSERYKHKHQQIELKQLSYMLKVLTLTLSLLFCFLELLLELLACCNKDRQKMGIRHKYDSNPRPLHHFTPC